MENASGIFSSDFSFNRKSKANKQCPEDSSIIRIARNLSLATQADTCTFIALSVDGIVVTVLFTESFCRAISQLIEKERKNSLIPVGLIISLRMILSADSG